MTISSLTHVCLSRSGLAPLAQQLQFSAWIPWKIRPEPAGRTAVVVVLGGGSGGAGELCVILRDRMLVPRFFSCYPSAALLPA